MEEDWEEAAAAEAVAARVASDTARFLPETTPLLLAAAAKATEAAEVAASSGDSSDEEGMESDARGPPEGVASYDDDYDFDDDEEEEEVHAITALRTQALAAAADQGEEGVAMGFLSLRRTASTDEGGSASGYDHC